MPGGKARISLPDSSKVLENLFKMLYKGEFQGTLKDIMELKIAAKKYLLNKISLWCVTRLYYLTDVDNAVEILVFGHKYNHKVLKHRSIILIGR